MLKLLHFLNCTPLHSRLPDPVTDQTSMSVLAETHTLHVFQERLCPLLLYLNYFKLQLPIMLLAV